MAKEHAITFPCCGDPLVGILHIPEQPLARGVVVVPGAPQYRVGSHRQLVLLARELAAHGTAVLRFDYRGMGDSDGEFRSFDLIGDDLRAAISELRAQVPEVREIVLWGFCDGASAASFYAHSDPSVHGVVLVNPWVRDRDTTDRAVVRHYYLAQLRSRAFWRRLLSAEIDFRQAVADLVVRLARLIRRGVFAITASAPQDPEAALAGPLHMRVAQGLAAFEGRILLFLSGADLTAQEFEESVLKAASVKLRQQHENFQIVRLDGANHTYSALRWRRQVHDITVKWLHSRPSNS